MAVINAEREAAFCALKHLTNKIGDNPQMAVPVLAALDALHALKDDPEQLSALLTPALAQVRDKLPASCAEELRAYQDRRALTQPSVVEVCDFRDEGDGTVSCFLPRGLRLVDLFERANAECESLGIYPAVAVKDLSWWRARSNKAEAANPGERFQVKGVVPEFYGPTVLNKRSAPESYGGVASIDHYCLANVLAHRVSLGKRDLGEGKWIKTRMDSVVVVRNCTGLCIGSYMSDRHHGVAYAASRVIAA